MNIEDWIRNCMLTYALDVYSDALLSAHEAEIARLEALKEQRAPTLQMIDKHRSLVKDREDLAASSQDASRLMMKGQKGEKRDPTRLLREEKMRKRIAKELPKVEADLRKVLERWEDEYGRPFMVHGERYLDEITASAARAMPPRSKTPSGPPPSTKSNKSASSNQRGGNVRIQPSRAPSRAGTKTPVGGSMMRSNPPASSASTAISTLGGRTPSPSKIPARKPLGNMPQGNNSPERRQLPVPPYPSAAMGKMGPPAARAPPPKMRDLYVPPLAPIPAHECNDQRSVSVSSSGSGSVRPVSPEDVYDDRERMSYLQTSMLRSQRATPQTYQETHPYGDRYEQSHHPSNAGTRQISTTSTATNTVSGSENWETYDDASDPEPDASEAYYAKLRAARGKRYTPEDGHSGPQGGQGKKFKGLRGVGAAETFVEGQMGRVPSGSEAGWTDNYEEAF